MFKNFLLFLLSLFVGISSFSQGNNSAPNNTPIQVTPNAPFVGEPCASHYAENELLKDPGYAKQRADFEARIQQYIQQNSGSRAAGVVYTIPVVFHIMHSGEAEGDSTNLSFAQIQSTMAALNRDFRRLGTDGGIANSGPLGQDAEIEFCMAQRDPNGNATNGVTRHDMSADQAYLDSGVYSDPNVWHSDAGIKNIVNWDNNLYLNVWVVNKIFKLTNTYSPGPAYTGGVQGYAFFPGAPSPLDGIVILSHAVGNDPTGALNYNLWFGTDDNRVFTHEIGHYLNLFHTFSGTTPCGPSGASCTTAGDRCCDTPPSVVGSNDNCNSPTCTLSNKENYMNYANRTCVSDFTQDQVDRMRAVLALSGFGGRNVLVNSNSCVAPPGIDLELDTIIFPIDTICSNSFIPEIIVCNNSTTDTATSFDIKYRVDAGAETNFNWTGILAPTGCDTFFLPQVTSTNGVHTFTARIDSTSVNVMNVDSDASNNSKTNSFVLSGNNTPVTQMITACDSFVSPSGKVWKTDGVYNDTITNTFGCDSLLTFNLTISSNYRDTLVVTRCDSSFDWRGVTYFTTIVVNDTVTSAGCDSIFTLDFTRNPTFVTSAVIPGCDSVSLFASGRFVTSSGNYVDSLTTVNGCDSLFLYSVQLGFTSNTTQNVTTCDSLVSPSGKVWKTSGTYLDTIPRTSGCDSIITFNLTLSNNAIIVNPPVSGCDSVQVDGVWYDSTQTIYDTVISSTSSGCDTIKETSITIDTNTTSITTLAFCDSLVSASGKVYKKSGFYRDTMPNAAGCDSLVEYYLTANRSSVSNQLINACGSYTSPFGNTYTTSGNFSDTLTTSKGCDSIINTYLIIDTVARVTIDSAICFGDSIILSTGTVGKTTGVYNDTTFGSIPSNLLYSEDFQGSTFSFTLNTNDTNAITPGTADNAWIINNSYQGGSVFGSPIVNTPNQDAAISGNINSTYLHIHNRRSAALSFPSITNSNYIDGNIILLGGQNGLNFSKMTNDISTLGKSVVSFDMYYLCRGSFGRLYYSLNSGTTWTRVGGDINNGGENWSQLSIVDSIFANQPTLRFAVGFNNTDGLGVSPGFAVDEIAIYGVGASSTNCDSITTINLTVSPLNDTTVFDTICRGQSIALPNGGSASATGIYSDTLMSNSGCDSIILTNLFVHDTTQSSFTLRECDSVTSPSGKVWKTSGMYIDSIANSVGCDSVMNIQVIVDTMIINSKDTILCFGDSLVLSGGTVIKTSQVISDTFATINCDSAVIFTITILPLNDTILFNTFCSGDSFTLPSGRVVTTAGVYYDTINSNLNCDSIIETNLSMRTSSSSTIMPISCGSYTSPSGKTYTTSGTYNDTIPNSGGCDSLITINLTILTATTNTVLANGCDTFSLPGGSVVTATGTYRDTLINGNGCDSIIITNLILGNSSNVTNTFSLCAGETVTVGSNVYGATGMYSDTFATALGCDSIINTNLTINPLTPGVITSTSNMCQDASAVAYTATPAGGKWRGPGIDSTTGLFDPAVSGVGIHTITYTGPGPCGRTDTAFVEVYSVPIITTIITDDECDVGQGEIDVTIIGGTPTIVYTWSSGDITEDLTGLKQGTFTLSVEDANGCMSSETMTLVNVSTPDCNYNIFVPNIFSPDGNGENDILKVEGNGIETLNFTVFNRWGNLVFQSTSPDIGWNGAFKGKPVTQGAFVYFVKGTFVDGSPFEEKGTVTVIRR